MNYSKDEFFDLMEKAEAQGCVHRDEVCVDTTYEFDGRRSPVRMRGCHNATLFDVPYESFIDARQGTVQRVCAVDDAMGRWPRFGGDKYARKGNDG